MSILLTLFVGMVVFIVLSLALVILAVFQQRRNPETFKGTRLFTAAVVCLGLAFACQITGQRLTAVGEAKLAALHATLILERSDGSLRRFVVSGPASACDLPQMIMTGSGVQFTVDGTPLDRTRLHKVLMTTVHPPVVARGSLETWCREPRPVRLQEVK